MVGPQIILGIKSFCAKAMGFSPAKIGHTSPPPPDNSGEQNSP